MPRSYLLPILLAVLVLCPLNRAVADDDMQWQFYEGNDPDNKGAMTARLVYGVPETDNVQVMGACDARPSTSAQFASVTFGANIGDLANGKEASLRFSGGGFEQTLDGHIVRIEGEGLSGVELDIKNDDPLWAALSEKESLDYSVPGYRAATLNFAGRENLTKFIEACRTYETAVLGDDADAAGNEEESSEKDAFESAKELGTVAAFEAFLSSYSSGFYADLARAYIDKLKTTDDAGEGEENDTAEPAPPAPSPKPKTAAASSPSSDPSCKDLFKVKSQGSDTPAKITFINKSGMYRSILWLDFSGHPKDYANLQAGEEVTLDTFLTHPWMVTDGPGDCVEIVMPLAGTRVVTLKAPDGSVKAAPPPAPAPNQAAPAPKPAPKTVKCRSRSVLIDGKCILKKNAASYCGPGYRLQGNKCVQGYAKPKPQIRLPTWQLEGLKHGCKPGLAWNAQEGCHEND